VEEKGTQVSLGGGGSDPGKEPVQKYKEVLTFPNLGRGLKA